MHPLKLLQVYKNVIPVLRKKIGRKDGEITTDCIKEQVLATLSVRK